MKLVITWIFLSEEEYLYSHHHYLEGTLLNHQIMHKSFLGKSLSFLLQGFSGNLEGFCCCEHGLELLLLEKKL